MDDLQLLIDLHRDATRQGPGGDAQTRRAIKLSRLQDGFVLPEQCWLEAYYRPMQKRFATFLEAHASSDSAKAMVAAQERRLIFMSAIGSTSVVATILREKHGASREMAPTDH